MTHKFWICCNSRKMSGWPCSAFFFNGSHLWKLLDRNSTSCIDKRVQKWALCCLVGWEIEITRVSQKQLRKLSLFSCWVSKFRVHNDIFCTHTFVLDVNLDFFVYTARTLFLNGEKMLINCFECEDKKNALCSSCF